jgi:hypothetical protein
LLLRKPCGWPAAAHHPDPARDLYDALVED